MTAAAKPKQDTVWRGAKALRKFLVPIADLQPSPGNPRRGDVGIVRESLRRFGQTRPVLTDAEDGSRIIAGHHVVLAAVEEGWTHVAAIPNEFESADEAARYLLMDNRSHDRGDYELRDLHDRLAELAGDDASSGLAGTGYAVDDLQFYRDQLDAQARAATPPAEFPPLDPDGLATEHRCPACGYEWSGNPAPGASANGDGDEG